MVGDNEIEAEYFDLFGSSYGVDTSESWNDVIVSLPICEKSGCESRILSKCQGHITH
jgi:hypothetical protein